MSIRWTSIVVDSHDVRAQARWWAGVLGWAVIEEDDDFAEIAPPHLLGETRLPPREQRGPTLEFVRVPDTKTLKNRLHIDLSPAPGDDQEAEVRRVESLGARRVDIGQGDVSWVVLADPEGNEFCVLTPRD